MLRFWIDDDPRPFIQVPLAAALDGSAGEIFAPPFGRAYPHSLAWYYPVSFTKRLVVAIDHVGPLDLVYYQLDFVANAEHQSPPDARSPERDTAKALLSGDAPPQLSELLAPAPFSIGPGQTATVATLSGPATVHELAVTIARVDLPQLGELTLAVTWDGEPAPAIAAPLAFLFASALSEPTEPSLALGSSATADEVTLWLRLPMPFRTSATVTLESSASAAVELSLVLRGKPGVPAEPFGNLHAEIQTTLAPASGSHHPVSSHAGPGRHVGTCLMLEGHGLKDDPLSSPLNFLEGDFRGLVDGVHALRDTGTEDFLDGCFYFESGPFGSALAHAWGVVDDGTSGRVSACRWHALAATIDYESSFEIDLEIGPGEPSLLDRYRSVALSYR
jgi:hypothetical protein